MNFNFRKHQLKIKKQNYKKYKWFVFIIILQLCSALIQQLMKMTSLRIFLFLFFLLSCWWKEKVVQESVLLFWRERLQQEQVKKSNYLHLQLFFLLRNEFEFEFDYILLTFFRQCFCFASEVCLDGSAPAYQFDEGFGEGVNNWLVHLEVCVIA